MASVSKFHKLLIGLLFLLALLIRIYHLGSASYWQDEMISLHFARSTDWKALFWDNHPPLYTLILKGWTSLSGTGEFFTRLLSVIFSMIGCIFAFLTLGISGLLWAALNPLSVLYAQETRMYALWEMFVWMQWYVLLKHFQTRQNSPPRNWIAATVLSSLTHYLAGLGTVLQTLTAMVIKVDSKFWKRAALIVCALALSGFLFIRFENLKWMQLRSMQGSGSVWDEMKLFWGGSFILGALLVLLFVVTSFQKKLEKIEVVQLAALLFLPGIFWFAGALAGRDFLIARYLIFLNPSLAIIFTCRSSAVKHNFTRFAMGTLLASFLLYNSFETINHKGNAPWRELSQYLSKQQASSFFTTRSLAIATPYFDQAHIKVEKLKENPLQSLQLSLASDASKESTVWIVENYWSSLGYYSFLSEELRRLGFQVEQLSFRNGNSDSLEVLRIKKQSTK